MISRYLWTLSITGLLLSSGIYAEKAKPKESVISQKMQIVQSAKPVFFKGLISPKENIQKLSLADFSVTSSKKIVIQRQGASFIKVHFNKLIIPENSFIEVKNSDASQVHRYGNISPSSYTLRDGDNGVTSFSALTIFGDTAIIELISPTLLSGSTVTAQPYHIEMFHLDS